MCVGVPISLIFIALVIGAQAAMQYANWEMAQSAGEGKVPIYWKYIPAVINSILIIVFGKIYKWLSYKLDIDLRIERRTFRFIKF